MNLLRESKRQNVVDLLFMIETGGLNSFLINKQKIAHAVAEGYLTHEAVVLAQNQYRIGEARNILEGIRRYGLNNMIRMNGQKIDELIKLGYLSIKKSRFAEKRRKAYLIDEPFSAEKQYKYREAIAALQEIIKCGLKDSHKKREIAHAVAEGYLTHRDIIWAQETYKISFLKKIKI